MVKALVHLGLTVGALIEMYTAQDKFRKILSGVAAGYHAHATLYHMFHEKEGKR
jgi:hypothetical protein